jgi:hypothetical protein
VVYHPPADFEGTDWFTFTANDGKASSAAASVEVTVVFEPIVQLRLRVEP